MSYFEFQLFVRIYLRMYVHVCGMKVNPIGVHGGRGSGAPRFGLSLYGGFLLFQAVDLSLISFYVGHLVTYHAVRFGDFYVCMHECVYVRM